MIKGLNNASKTKLIATKVKGMTFLILTTSSFIVCFFFFLASLLYNHKAKPYRNFQTDFISRCGFGGRVFSNGVMNIVINVVQMSDFREFLQITARKNEQLIPTKHKQQQWVALLKDNGIKIHN